MMLGSNPAVRGLVALLLIAVVHGSTNVGGEGGHHEPMVAMVCPTKGERVKTFQNKFIVKSGKWETDYGVKATCKTDKLDILEYCKQVYPDRKIENIVESTKYQKIDRWCKSGSLKCKGPAKWVKPYRCIEAVQPVTPSTTQKPAEQTSTEESEEEYYDDDDYLDEDDDDYYDDDDDDDYEYDDDDYYDDDYEDSMLNEIKTDEKKKKNKEIEDLSIDTYYTHYRPGEEHSEFTAALERLEERHRIKMTKVMKEWTGIERKYTSLAKSDKEHADKLKQEMTEQFEKRIENLEKENDGEKDQLIAMHQQRVVSRINQRKEAAMKCYTNSLNASPLSYPTVRQCLEKLLRALHKDRHHTLAHYRDLVETTPGQADLQREVTLQHLTDIDRIVNESLSLMDRFPDLRVKLLPLMEDFLIELRSRDETPAPLFSMDRSQEEKIIDGFKDTVINKIIHQEDQSREEKRLRTEELKRARQQQQNINKEIVGEDEVLLKGVNMMDLMEREKGIRIEEEDAEIQERVIHTNARAHQLIQDQPMYSVTGVESGASGWKFISVLGVGCVLVLIVAVVLFQSKKQTRIRSHQGFIEVPTHSSPEDKHLSTMQANGYENPTYRYFEATVA